MRRIVRNLARFAAHRLRLSYLPFTLYRLLRGKYFIGAFAYHRIVDSSRTKAYYTDYDRGLDARIFSMHLDSLSRHFQLVDLETFLDIVSGRRPPRSHTALLTFDDADSEFTRYALPELVRRKVPAVMMAPVGYIDSTEQLWHVRMSNAVRYATADHWAEIQRRVDEWPAPVADLVRQHPELVPQPDRRPLSQALNLALDLVKPAEVDRLIDEWECLIVPDGFLPIQCMNWTELQLLERSGIAVESHTLTHRKLTMLTDEEKSCELAQSKLTLEAKLDKVVKVVAYPQGRYEKSVGDAARAAGYEAAFTTVRTPCRYPLGADEMFAIPRLDVPGTTPGEVDLHLTRVGVRWLQQTKS